MGLVSCLWDVLWYVIWSNNKSTYGEPLTLVAEAGAIVLLAGAAYAMSAKEKLSLEKKRIRDEGRD